MMMMIVKTIILDITQRCSVQVSYLKMTAHSAKNILYLKMIVGRKSNLSFFFEHEHSRGIRFLVKTTSFNCHFTGQTAGWFSYRSRKGLLGENKKKMNVSITPNGWGSNRSW